MIPRDISVTGQSAPPLAIVVMGVSGSGKSTLGRRLAARLGCIFLEGDAFHPPANVARMREGHPLEDADRWPWLDRIGAALKASAEGHGLAVASCSALKRSYRTRLAIAAGISPAFLLLTTDPREIARRLRERADHYMPATLLDSQIATLEMPAPDERALVLDSGRTIEDLCDEAIAWLRTR